MSVHRIRLRGPWQFEWLSSSVREPASGRISLPADWRDLFGTESGQVCFRRKFNRPTNLEPGTDVNLVFEGVGGTATVKLNGQSLESQTKSHRYRITEHLAPSNELQVDLQFDPTETPEPGGLWGLVVLEIVE